MKNEPNENNEVQEESTAQGVGGRPNDRGGDDDEDQDGSD